MQIVPAIAERAGHVTVFQRSPQWAAPNEVYFAPIDERGALLMEHVPFYRRWYRARVSWNTGDRVHPALQKDPEWEQASVGQRRQRRAPRGSSPVTSSQLAGRDDLIAKALPDYPPFGKRMLLDNGWYAALRRDDVDLVTEPVTAVAPTGMGARTAPSTEVDVVVLATGFDATKFLWPMDIRGRGGPASPKCGATRRAPISASPCALPEPVLPDGPGTMLGHGGSYITIAPNARCATSSRLSGDDRERLGRWSAGRGLRGLQPATARRSRRWSGPIPAMGAGTATRAGSSRIAVAARRLLGR